MVVPMCNRRHVFRLTVFCFASLSLFPPLTRAGFVIINQSAIPDGGRRETRFSITFNRAPDFFHTDAAGNPHDAFQYWCDNTPGGFEFAGPDVAVIRGPEIRFNDTIPIRDSINDTKQELPHAEGWGPERGEVPFQLDGDTITFAVPWHMLDETDGRFSYRLFAFQDGTLTNEVAAAIIPLPPAVATGAVLLLTIPIARRWRSKNHPRLFS